MGLRRFLVTTALLFGCAEPPPRPAINLTATPASIMMLDTVLFVARGIGTATPLGWSWTTGPGGEDPWTKACAGSDTTCRIGVHGSGTMYFRFSAGSVVDSVAAAVVASVPPDVGDEPGDAPALMDTVFRIATGRDMTGDGVADTIRLLAGSAADAGGSVKFNLTVESNGDPVYGFWLHDLTRRAEFDGKARELTDEEFRKRLDAIRISFFGDDKFETPTVFLAKLRMTAPKQAERIAEVIEADWRGADTRSGTEIWKEIIDSNVPVFTYSPGGDEVVAMAWSIKAKRFYRLLSCC